MKIFFLFPFLFLCACTIGEPKSVSELSREEAIRIYNGGIAEADWLAQLNVTANANAVRLSDGFIFYKTEDRDGVAWINAIILPVDAPEAVKTLARSFRQKAEPTKEICLNKDTIWLDGTIISEQQLRAEAERLQAFPRSRRPHCKLVIGDSVNIATESRIRGILKKSGIIIESAAGTGDGI